MNAIAIGRSILPAKPAMDLRSALRRRIVAALRALLDRMPAEQGDVPQEFYRYPFP